MKKSFAFSAITIVAVFALGAIAMHVAPHAADMVPAQQTTVDPGSDTAFAEAENVVNSYLTQHSSFSVNHVCVVGFNHGGDPVAWVLWREGQKAILWEAGENDLSLSRRQLDLRTDIVESEADKQGSTYRETRDWLAALEAECRTRGQQFTIQK